MFVCPGVQRKVNINLKTLRCENILDHLLGHVEPKIANEE
jgi:hypothetical protein